MGQGPGWVSTLGSKSVMVPRQLSTQTGCFRGKSAVKRDKHREQSQNLRCVTHVCTRVWKCDEESERTWEIIGNIYCPPSISS